jgi:hypothetical protein
LAELDDVRALKKAFANTTGRIQAIMECRGPN